jgi:hypothetical protein
MIDVGAMHYADIFPLFHCHGTGKKFWNLFHLQPMRDQKVLTPSIVEYALCLINVCVSMVIILIRTTAYVGGASILHWCSA